VIVTIVLKEIAESKGYPDWRSNPPPTPINKMAQLEKYEQKKQPKLKAWWPHFRVRFFTHSIVLLFIISIITILSKISIP
jgi:hypothetical protein